MDIFYISLYINCKNFGFFEMGRKKNIHCDLVWYKRIVFEILWGTCYIFGLMPRWFRYGIMHSFFTAILRLLGYRKRVILENLRKSFPEKSESEIKHIMREYYRTLSEDREQVAVEYRSELMEMPLADVLLRSRERDIVNQFTTAGVHRDDIVFTIGGYPLRKYGSQGQQKSFLIALKLAQYRLLAEVTAEKPILLLDDLFDKLDMGRVEKLLSLVGGDDFGQICITDCNKVRLESTLSRAGREYSLFIVDGGDVKQ